MSIGKRIFNLARSELNSLLDKAARIGDEDDDDASSRDGRTRLEDLSDEELEAEIERRKLERELRDRAQRARPTPGTGTRPSTGPRPSQGSRPQPPPRRPASYADEIARAYATLEVPAGSDFETVRKAYRNLMRKYHPDRHAANPQKQKAATELAQKLTENYKKLEKHLRK